MPRNVVYVAPFPAEITHRFARAVGQLHDVRLLGVVHGLPPAHEPRIYADVVRVQDPLSTADIVEGIEAHRRKHGPIHRVVGILEAIQVQLAEARAHFGIPGTPPAVAELFRDKSRMKAALAAAGLPVARNRLLTSLAEASAFVKETGFPIVLKPPAGMGAKSTFRIRTLAELEAAVGGLRVDRDRPILAEEFLQGREHSFETITVGGTVQLHSISRYYPPCLEAVENPWIQWCCLLPRDISGPEYDPARAIGFAAVRALGLQDGVTHMEWFERADGSLAIGEIAQRPPGANISLMTGVAHGMDMYRAWARAVVDGAFDGPYGRRFAVGSAFLRGVGRGRVAALRGVREANDAVGPHVVEAKLPSIGAAKSDSYEGDGYVVVRDPSTEVVKKLLEKVIGTVQVHYAD